MSYNPVTIIDGWISYKITIALNRNSVFNDSDIIHPKTKKIEYMPTPSMSRNNSLKSTSRHTRSHSYCYTLTRSDSDSDSDYYSNLTLPILSIDTNLSIDVNR